MKEVIVREGRRQADYVPLYGRNSIWWTKIWYFLIVQGWKANYFLDYVSELKEQLWRLRKK